MPLNRQRAQKYLQKFDFESLFIEELGWDTVDRVTLPFEVDGDPFEVVSITQKRGFTVFKCITPEIPTRPIRVKLDRQLTDYSKSHLLVFGDEGKTQQIWMWVRQELLESLGLKVVRVSSQQVETDLNRVLETICPSFCPHPLTPSPKEGEGEPEAQSPSPHLGEGFRVRGSEGKPRCEYFRKVLAEIAKHPNLRYFVLKSIMLNNLYGVSNSHFEKNQIKFSYLNRELV